MFPDSITYELMALELNTHHTIPQSGYEDDHKNEIPNPLGPCPFQENNFLNKFYTTMFRFHLTSQASKLVKPFIGTLEALYAWNNYVGGQGYP